MFIIETVLQYCLKQICTQEAHACFSNGGTFILLVLSVLKKVHHLALCFSYTHSVTAINRVINIPVNVR